MDPKEIIEALDGMTFSSCEVVDGTLRVAFVPQTLDPNGPSQKTLAIRGVEAGNISIEA
jgi:hypothetical protein